LSGCATGGFSRRAQLHGVSPLCYEASVYGLTEAVSAAAWLELAVVNAEVHVARRSLHAQEPCVGVDHLDHVGVVPCQPEGS
jgi:hypothetical protein